MTVLSEVPGKIAPLCPGCGVSMKFVKREIDTLNGQTYDMSTYECSQDCGKCFGMQIQNHMNQDGSLKINYTAEIAA